MAKKASLTKAQQTASAIHEAGRLAGYEEGLRAGQRQGMWATHKVSLKTQGEGGGWHWWAFIEQTDRDDYNVVIKGSRHMLPHGATGDVLFRADYVASLEEAKALAQDVIARRGLLQC